jgi:DNA ligase-1
VEQFADLLHRLAFTPQRNGKLRLMQQYFATAPDPDRGYGLAALTGTLNFAHAKPALIRSLAESRADPYLFALSYDFVGDLAETVALIWRPRTAAAGAVPAPSAPAPSLSAVVETLAAAPKPAVPALLEQWLDALDASGRYALLKLLTGELRVGVSARLAKTAVASLGGRDVGDIEELWHGLAPPYLALFAWIAGGPLPARQAQAPVFRPLMLATALEEADLPKLDATDYAAEWKWDGIRVQAVGGASGRALFSRTGDEIGLAFPDMIEALDFEAVLDGELLVAREGAVASFNDLQQRLGRKQPSRTLLAHFPAHLRLYDLLVEAGEDLRSLPFIERRARLERWFERTRPERMDLSPLLVFASWDELAALRAGAREAAIEGLMLKRKDSPYLAGRPKGPWFKWKRDPLRLDCVLMYAQRGHGRRSSYYSDYTFGCWRDTGNGERELVPVGKAYFGFTDAELRELDRWVRLHTIERFGPVRAVAPELVLEIAFDAVQRSARHKSGVAMRFPRVHRIRWDKPAAEADSLAVLTALIGSA